MPDKICVSDVPHVTDLSLCKEVLENQNYYDIQPLGLYTYITRFKHSFLTETAIFIN